MVAPVVDVPGDVDVVLEVDCDLRIEDGRAVVVVFLHFMGGDGQFPQSYRQGSRNPCQVFVCLP